MAAPHPVEVFRAWLDEHVTDWPAGVVPVPEPLHATAFFAAGPGLWLGERGELPLPPAPVGGVMFVGDALGSEGGYRAWREARGAVTVMPTWRGILRLLEAVPLPETEVFFTNVYLGLLVGDRNAVRHPASTDPAAHRAFRELCWRFLELQIATLRPRALVCLGTQPLRFLPEFLYGLEDWAGRRITELDTPDLAVRAVTVGDHRVPAVPILHPANFHKTGMLRRWRGHPTIDTEVELVRSVLDHAAG